MYLEPEFQYVVEAAGANVGTHLVMRTKPREPAFKKTLNHELAHFYFKGHNLPHWLSEGGSEFLASYTLHLSEDVSFQSLYFRAIEETRRRGCADLGAGNVQQLLKATEGLPYREYLRTQLWACHYPLGETFLLGMSIALGHETVSSSMRELYRLGESRGFPVTEDEIYQEFLSNTPSDKRDRFREMYQCFHGRPIPGHAYTAAPVCDPSASLASADPGEAGETAPVQWVFLNGETPLHRAAINAGAAVVEQLMDQGAEVNAKAEIQPKVFGDPTSGVTPLHLGARYNEPAVVAAMLDRGADINAKDDNGNTPLHLAATNTDQAVAALLLGRGADINAKDDRGATPLHEAARFNPQPAVAALLLDRGADINDRDGTNRGYTPLLLAAKYNRQPAVAALLLDRGADTNAKDNFFKGMAVHHSAHGNGPEVVALMLDRGADVNTKDGKGRTPLHYAVANHYYADADNPQGVIALGPLVAALLLDRGADINAKDDSGSMPLQSSVGNVYPATAALLLDRGADINNRNYAGYTALHDAVSESGPETVAKLLDLGADVGASSNLGLTPLHIAAGFQVDFDLKVPELLLDRGADVNAKDGKGLTPLHYAAASDIVLHRTGEFLAHLELVALLLDRGADANAQDVNGFTPCQRAKNRGASTASPVLKRLCSP